ncbi:MAG TPA: hypothetical protein VHE30_10800 [Polyangiaceae bacterium]|nr:hypothetical protein [Polyangiaceae bacterium]
MKTTVEPARGLFPGDLVGQDEFTYLVVLVMLAVIGPGRLAVDHFIAKRLDAAGS